MLAAKVRKLGGGGTSVQRGREAQRRQGLQGRLDGEADTGGDVPGIRRPGGQGFVMGGVQLGCPGPYWKACLCSRGSSERV